MSKKERIDVLLVSQGLESSRERAKALIMSGDVLVNGQRVDKAGEEVPIDAEIKIKTGLKYVSRGGLKLEKAISSFDIDVKDLICMDIGASTGGFTDCMLQNGAKKVYSVDVGYGQLAWKLRTNPNVVNLERTNIRYLSHEIVTDNIDFFSVDVSFISLTLVLPVIKEFLSEFATGVCLIKPQFEAGKGKVGKKGVVRDPSIHEEVIQKIADFVVNIGFSAEGIDYSPVKGPEGNIEYLIYLKNHSEGNPNVISPDVTKNLVSNSHAKLNGGA